MSGFDPMSQLCRSGRAMPRLIDVPTYAVRAGRIGYPTTPRMRLAVGFGEQMAAHFDGVIEEFRTDILGLANDHDWRRMKAYMGRWARAALQDMCGTDGVECFVMGGNSGLCLRNFGGGKEGGVEHRVQLVSEAVSVAPELRLPLPLQLLRYRKEHNRQKGIYRVHQAARVKLRSGHRSYVSYDRFGFSSPDPADSHWTDQGYYPSWENRIEHVNEHLTALSLPFLVLARRVPGTETLEDFYVTLLPEEGGFASVAVRRGRVQSWLNLRPWVSAALG